MTKSLSTSLLVVCLALAACHKEEAPAASASAAVSEADAAKAFDATVAGWQSMDAARIKGLYAPDVAGFDYSYAPLVTDKALWDKNQDAFAAAKFDKIEVKEKKIQLLGPDAFLVSSTSSGTSKANPGASFTFRCTDAYKRQADGAWLIVNENCAPPPKA